MIELLLAGALLLSDAEDCAVLVAALGLPVPDEELFENIEMPADIYVLTRPPRVGFEFDCRDVSPWSHEGFLACKREQVAQYDSMSVQQRLEDSASLRVEVERRLGQIEAFSGEPDDSVEIPAGLIGSFLETVSEQQLWGCYPQDWQFIEYDHFSDLWETSDPELPNGRSLQMTRPGYSADGQWAIAFFTETYSKRPLDVPVESGIINYIMSATGYVVFQRTASGWQLADRNIYLMTGTGEP